MISNARITDPDRPTPPTGRSPLALQVSDAIRRHGAGDASALTDLTRSVLPWLHHVVRNHRIPAHAVDDAVQSTLLAVLLHLGELRDPDAGLAWITVVARREAVREARVQQRQILVDEPDVVAPPAPDTAEIALERMSHAVVRSNVRKLALRHRLVLERIARHDRPDYASISTALQMPIGSIGPTRRRGLDRMRQLLTDDPAWEWDVPA